MVNTLRSPERDDYNEKTTLVLSGFPTLFFSNQQQHSKKFFLAASTLTHDLGSYSEVLVRFTLTMMKCINKFGVWRDAFGLLMQSAEVLLRPLRTTRLALVIFSVRFGILFQRSSWFRSWHEKSTLHYEREFFVTKSDAGARRYQGFLDLRLDQTWEVRNNNASRSTLLQSLQRCEWRLKDLYRHITSAFEWAGDVRTVDETRKSSCNEFVQSVYMSRRLMC